MAPVPRQADEHGALTRTMPVAETRAQGRWFEVNCMSKSVLVVDDSMTMRQMVGFTLKQAGFTVIEACDGQDAMEKLPGCTVDLVITDLNMPRLDGIGFIRALRQQPQGRHIPVLMLTTESQDARKKEGRAAGATGWIVKPFHPDRLLQVVEKVLP